MLKKIVKKILNNFHYQVIHSDILKLQLLQSPSLRILIETCPYQKSICDDLVIFDIGANIGQSCAYFRENFPDSKIFSFEPIPSTFEKLLRFVEKLPNNEEIHCYDLGMGFAEGSFEIFLKENSGLNSLSNNLPLHTTELPVEIKITTLDKFFKSQDFKKIDLLKIDVEGYEIEVLKGAEELLKSHSITFVALEVGFLKNDKQHTSFCKIHEHLEEKGYNLVGFYDQCRYQSEQGFALGYCNALYVSSDIHKT